MGFESKSRAIETETKQIRHLMLNFARLLDDLKLQDHKTKNIAGILDKLGLDNTVLMVVKDYDENILRATSNLDKMLLVKAATANVYQLLRFDKLLFTKDALDDFVQRLA